VIGPRIGATLKGPLAAPFFVRGGRRPVRVVAAGANGYIAGMVTKTDRIILADHARLPWRFFARLAIGAQTAL